MLTMPRASAATTPLTGDILTDETGVCQGEISEKETAVSVWKRRFLDVQINYRYCLIRSEAFSGSSVTEMVIFMLLAAANPAAQLMNSSP